MPQQQQQQQQQQQSGVNHRAATKVAAKNSNQNSVPIPRTNSVSIS